MLITVGASAGGGGCRRRRRGLFEQFFELHAEAVDHLALIFFAFPLNGGAAALHASAQGVELAADAADLHFERFEASGYATLVFLFN